MTVISLFSNKATAKSSSTIMITTYNITWSQYQTQLDCSSCKHLFYFVTRNTLHRNNLPPFFFTMHKMVVIMFGETYCRLIFFLLFVGKTEVFMPMWLTATTAVRTTSPYLAYTGSHWHGRRSYAGYANSLFCLLSLFILLL